MQVDYKTYVDSGKVTHMRKVLPRRIINQFTWKHLLNTFADTDLQVKCYEKGGDRSLYAESLSYMDLEAYYRSDDNYLAVKHSFDKSSQDPFLRYVVNTIEQKIPLADHRLGKASYTLRISPRSWAFPRHFDGIANFMILLNGTRNVEISYKDDTEISNHHLRPGDIFYIPPMWSHYFTAINKEPAIVLNLAFYTEEGEQQFRAAYPRRVEEIQQRL